MKPVHVIAEAGTNHGGSLQVAKQLVDIAKAAGADSVKFQIIYPEGLYLPKFHQGPGQYAENEVFHLRAAAMLSEADYAELAAYCTTHTIPLSASVFDTKGMDLLCGWNPPYIKIASCDLNNDRLLEQAAARGKKVIISTGMATLGEVEHAVATLDRAGNRDLVIMHCVSQYPCPLEKMNLSFLATLKTAFGLPIGLSDHTESSLAAAIAISMGVEWIEKHCTYDRKAKGFDHAYAMEPDSLAKYIQDIRSATAAVTKQAIKVQEGEANVKKRARRSIYAAHSLKKGSVLGESDLLVVRPEGEIDPTQLPLLLGQTIGVDVEPYEPITWKKLA